MITILRAAHIPQKIFIMRNHNQLEISLLLPRFNNLRERAGEGFNIVSVEVGGGLVEGDELMRQKCKCEFRVRE